MASNGDNTSAHIERLERRVDLLGKSVAALIPMLGTINAQLLVGDDIPPDEARENNLTINAQLEDLERALRVEWLEPDG